MVFGKLFGKGKMGGDPGNSAYAAWLSSLDPMWRDAVQIVSSDPKLDEAFKNVFRGALQNGNLEEARAKLRECLPFMTEGGQARLQSAGQMEHWSSDSKLLDAGIIIPKDKREFIIDKMRLGRLPVDGPEDDDLGIMLWFQGEGHLLTVAPSGAGKGQRFILHNLLTYEGPVVVLDPKGENYRETAWRRSHFGQVFKWSPFEADSDCYNPLDRVNSWDEARLLAELLIVPQSKEPFWDNAAKDLLTGLIFYVLRTRKPGRRNMREVCRILAGSKSDMAAMIETLQKDEDERLRELGNVLEGQSESLSASIGTTLRTQLEIWRSEGVVNTTSSSTPDFSADRILDADNSELVYAARGGAIPGCYERDDGQIERGLAASVYLVVPSEKISSYRSVLRVILGQLLSGAIEHRGVIEAENAEIDDLPRDYPRWPITFIFDELPQLGYMRLIEDAVAITRSYGIRLWLFTQDLAQLKEVYPKWESLIANCRCQVFFRPNDLGTAEHIAMRLGRRKDIWGSDDWVASPQQLMGPDFREDCILFQDGLSVRARMFKPLYADPNAQTAMASLKSSHGTEVLRAPRPEAPPPDPEPEVDEPVTPRDNGGAGLAASQKEPGPDGETDDLSDDPEYQAELAALQARMRARKAETSNKPPESPVESSDTDKRPPTPPDFND